VKRFDIDALRYAVRMRPVNLPIGLQLTRASRAVSRAFDDALDEAGGSLPVWLVLLNLKTRRPANQRELAEAVGVREATLTHHLNAMDAEGLITRRRDTANRRIHVVELTEAGEGAFLRLRTAAVAFDHRLRRGITDQEIAGLEGVLDRLASNVGSERDQAAPWAGLVETKP
jgi:MarR family transcriptional regulator, transcriptional regulator for hemolysin